MPGRVRKPDTSERIKGKGNTHGTTERYRVSKSRVLYIEQVSVDHPQWSSRRVGPWVCVLVRLHVVYLREESLERKLDVGRVIRGRFHVHHSIFR